MKKKVLIIAVIFVLVALAALATVFIVKGIKNNSRSYEIEKVSEYNYFVLQDNNKFGVINKDAKVIIEPTYYSVIIPNPQKAVFICVDENNGNKVLNEKNEEILTDYTGIESIRLKNIVSDLMYEKSVLKYKENEKYGLIDYNGKKITEAIYDQIQTLEYKEGELLVEKDVSVLCRTHLFHHLFNLIQ